MKYIDMHCDTLTRLFNLNRKGQNEELRENKGHVDLVRMKTGDCLAQNFAIFTSLKNEPDPYGYCMALCEMFKSQMKANQDLIDPATTVKEILENEKKGKMSAVLTIEEGAVCKGDPDILRDFYQLGVRMMTLTWNYENDLAYPNKIDPATGRSYPETEKGLKKRGEEFVEMMEELGMIIDVSHLGDAGFREVLARTKNPFVASHSNARSLASHTRNLTDDMIKALAERGGVMGINFCATFLTDGENGRESVDSRVSDLAAHMKHIKNIGGIECIGLGSDFDGIVGNLEIESPASLRKLEEVLFKNGFTIEEIEKIFYKNVLRVYKDVWK